jgi:hypothetical protein
MKEHHTQLIRFLYNSLNLNMIICAVPLSQTLRCIKLYIDIVEVFNIATMTVLY